MFTIGCDPEVMVADIKTNSMATAIDVLGGSKDKPLKVKKGAVQEDNVLAEFNIDPASTKLEFVGNINVVMRQLRGMLKARGLRPVYLASHSFKPEVLSHPKAWLFGCDPDFNAWLDGEVNIAPYSVNPYLRTAGGHIHVGWDNPTEQERLNVIRWMDLFIGVPSIILDSDITRRELYGKAGAYRPKSYGAEYRVVSNFWIKSPALMRWVYDMTKRAVEHKDDISVVQDAEIIIETINKGNRAGAGVLMSKYGLSIRRDVFKK